MLIAFTGSLTSVLLDLYLVSHFYELINDFVMLYDIKIKHLNDFIDPQYSTLHVAQNCFFVS